MIKFGPIDNFDMVMSAVYLIDNCHHWLTYLCNCGTCWHISTKYYVCQCMMYDSLACHWLLLVHIMSLKWYSLVDVVHDSDESLGAHTIVHHAFDQLFELPLLQSRCQGSFSFFLSTWDESSCWVSFHLPSLARRIQPTCWVQMNSPSACTMLHLLSISGEVAAALAFGHWFLLD
jgi:hypothetical protein